MEMFFEIIGSPGTKLMIIHPLISLSKVPRINQFTDQMREKEDGD